MYTSLLGFLYGSVCKLIDDSFDIHIIENVYIIEFLKVTYVIVSVLLFQLKNYNVYIMIFSSWNLISFLPDAYTTEPFFGIMTIFSLLVSAYYLFIDLNLYHIFLFSMIFYLECFSGFFTEIGERVPYTSYIKSKFPNVYSFFFLEEDVEISKKKMCFRLLNAVVAILFLLFVNNWIIQYLNRTDEDFKTGLTITSMYIFGYNIVSFINQYNMIYIKGVEYQKIHKQVDGFFGIKDKTEHVQDEIVQLEVHPK